MKTITVTLYRNWVSYLGKKQQKTEMKKKHFIIKLLIMHGKVSVQSSIIIISFAEVSHLKLRWKWVWALTMSNVVCINTGGLENEKAIYCQSSGELKPIFWFNS